MTRNALGLITAAALLSVPAASREITSAAPAAQAPIVATLYLPLVHGVERLESPDPGPYMPDAKFVLGGPAMAVEVVGDVAFVGVGANLAALDVSGDGDPPTIGTSPPLPGTVMDVVVRDGMAYVAVHQATALDDVSGGLFILDVTDPTSIEIVGQGALRGAVTRVVLDGEHAILLGPAPFVDGIRMGASELTVFTISDPAEPELLMQHALDSDVVSMLTVERTAFLCSNGMLHQMQLDADPLVPIPISPDVSCSALGATDDGKTLGVAAGDELEDGPMLQLFDISDLDAPELLHEIDLTGSSRHGGELRFTDVELSSRYLLVVGRSAAGGVIYDIDPFAPDWPEQELIVLREAVLFGADASDGRIVMAGGSDGTYRNEKAHELIEDGAEHVLGSEVLVWERSREWPIAEAPIGRRSGPGTFVTLLDLNDDQVFVLGHSARITGGENPYYGFAEDDGRLWAIDGAGDVLSTGRPQPTGFFHGEAWPGRAAATNDALFLGHYDSTEVFAVIDGALVPEDDIPLGGAVVADGEILAIASLDRTLQVTLYDVGDPVEPELLSTIVIPEEIEGERPKMAMADGWLWWSLQHSRSDGSLVLIDVHDPRAPEIAGLWLDRDRLHFEEVGSIVARGRDAYVAPIDSGEHIVSFSVSETIGPEHVASADLLSELGQHTSPFWLAGESERLWMWGIADDTWPSGQRRSVVHLNQVDASDPASLRTVESKLLPAAIRARVTAGSESRLSIPAGLGLKARDGLVVGSRIEGGVFGVAP